MDWTCSKNVSGRTVKEIFDSKLEGKDLESDGWKM
jgi:hypothetical protein